MPTTQLTKYLTERISQPIQRVLSAAKKQHETGVLMTQLGRQRMGSHLRVGLTARSRDQATVSEAGDHDAMSPEQREYVPHSGGAR